MTPSIVPLSKEILMALLTLFKDDKSLNFYLHEVADLLKSCLLSYFPVLKIQCSLKSQIPSFQHISQIWILVQTFLSAIMNPNLWLFHKVNLTEFGDCSERFLPIVPDCNWYRSCWPLSPRVCSDSVLT